MKVVVRGGGQESLTDPDPRAGDEPMRAANT